MKVNNIEQAWHEVEKIISKDYLEDYEASKRAGYAIYRSLINHDYVCNLGDRLEINLENGQTINIWIENPTTIEEYAACEASTITIRSYQDGNSNDTMRSSTNKEKKILKGIISGALSAIRSGKKAQETASVAEYIALHLLPETEEGHCNAFISVYRKIINCPDYLLRQ